MLLSPSDLSHIYSHIDGTINLFSTTSTFAGGSFQVDVCSSNAPLDLVLSSVPIDSLLHASARTTNAHATASVHPAFEGTYALYTPWYQPEAKVSPSPDLAGRGRMRAGWGESGRGCAQGAALWVEGTADGRGSVEITTSNALVTLAV